MSHRAQDYLLTGEVPQRTGTATTGSAPAQVFRCQDGEINIQSGDQPAFEALCEVLDLRPLARDPRFRTRADRWRHRSELLPPIEAAIARWRQRDLYDALVARAVVAAPIYTLDQTFSDPQVIHRGMRSQVPHFNAVAVPVRSVHGGRVYGLSASGLDSVWPREKLLAIGQKLIAIAKELSVAPPSPRE